MAICSFASAAALSTRSSISVGTDPLRNSRNSPLRSAELLAERLKKLLEISAKLRDLLCRSSVVLPLVSDQF